MYSKTGYSCEDNPHESFSLTFDFMNMNAVVIQIESVFIFHQDNRFPLMSGKCFVPYYV